MIASSLNRSKVFNCTEHVINTSKELKHFYDRGELVDVVLVAGTDDVKAQAHRIILSASSNYFRAMFGIGLKEADAEEITLNDIDGITLKLILDFLYSGTIELESGTVERILKAADCFQINSLIDACCEFMAEELDPCNCLGICLLAEQHNYTTLYEKSSKFVYEYFEKVYTEKEFLQLNEPQLSKFLIGAEVFMTSAEQVLLSVVAWITHDRPNREQFTCSLLSHVRFKSLDSKFIIENTKSICKSTESYELIHKWLEWHLSPGSRTKCATEHTKSKFVLGACDSNFKFQSYDPDLEKWSYEEWPYPRYNRKGYDVIVMNNKLIIVGGNIDENGTNTVECLDLHTMEWTELPPMNEARYMPAVAELNGRLYVVGGLRPCCYLTSVEVFDFTLRTWTYSEPLPRPIHEVKAAVLNGLLYVAGNNIRWLECYNPESCGWSKTASRRYKSNYDGIAAVGGHLYIGIEFCGAGDEILKIERYDPRNNTWEKVKTLDSSCYLLRCAAWNNRLILYCLIGESLTKTEEYDPETDKWKTLTPPLPDKFRYSHLFTIQSES